MPDAHDRTRRPILVLGDAGYRARVAGEVERALRWPTADCDPVLGDCVMYLGEEGRRYAAFVFVGFADPVTRGGLPRVAERAVLVPLADRAHAPEPLVEGYLFRLPRAIGFRDDVERDLVVRLVPKAKATRSVLLGPSLDRADGWSALLDGVLGRRRRHDRACPPC